MENHSFHSLTGALGTLCIYIAFQLNYCLSLCKDLSHFNIGHFGKKHVCELLFLLSCGITWQ